MPTVVRMPEVLANATEAVIQSWLVSEGQDVEVGDALAEVETEKAVVELAAEVAGVLARLIAEPGATIAVGDPIAIVLAPGESEADLDAPPQADPAPATPTADPDLESGASADPDSGAPVLEAASQRDNAPVRAAAHQQTVESEREAPPPVSPATNGSRLFATPLVRKLAGERNIDLSTVTGTGPGGRIVRRDLDRLAISTPAPVDPAAESPKPTPAPAAVADGFTDEPLTGMRRAIARRLTESKTTVPHFYVKADCRVDALMELRRSVNEAAAVKISLNDFVLKAVAGALVEVPEANAIWNDTSIRRFDEVDLAVAVAVDGGLLTPVLRGVDQMSLSAVASTVGDLAQRARDGRLKQAELEGGSFSVSNLGMYGVSEFSAILNPPQSGILAVGGATPRPVVVDGQLAVATVMTVTLSADHRVIDGAVAAQWMAAFVRRIENPLTILI
ncbi:2-oxo acid dehydrogenase subunit E2 [Mycobacterium yunnanensis]|uniref:Dihydrolipoamide acetyltransferase component of pyruvate dehydrogenase complex n=1 Tax=Mycobacterium yunnanensis TaxID=368477 RepID=A0A9X2Z4P0_9MYCO|nr:dihydrolipoamide acetyltransferase family protein [Mycobacterium yunnanensis]MCV7421787.1 2-oxo acid dehydrogenase subunit E2 [Mycobacterium yunnanensis]